MDEFPLQSPQTIRLEESQVDLNKIESPENFVFFGIWVILGTLLWWFDKT
jgi:hypothetical protein